MDLTITIDGVDYTQHTALPVKWNALLDERLDEGRLSLHHTQKDLFRIGAEVFINDMGFVIAEDEAVETPPGSGFYNHELILIEPTKELEGIVVESLTFTNNLGRTYENVVKIDVEPLVTPSPGGSLSLRGKVWLQGPVSVGETISIPSTNGLDRPISTNGYAYPSGGGAKNDVKVTDPSGDVIFSASGTYSAQKVTINKLGQYTVIYTYGLQAFGTNSGANNYDIVYTFVAIDLDKAALLKWNITSVIDRVLNLAEPHLQRVKPRFFLDGYPRNNGDADSGQHLLFSKIEAPEFAFTKCTLKEILDQIGGYIHGIPSLIRGESGMFDTIHFDMLGGTEEALLADPKYDGEYVTLIKTHNIENYATDLDSTADNLVNTLDSAEGSTVEPYSNGFKTVRSEEAYARIEEGNMVIATTLPIYSIQKLEVVDTKNNVGDITAYVFEGAEYGRLSSFDGNYPTSKAYALYYELGRRNIMGLNYKSPTVSGAPSNDYTITNIINAVTGTTVSSDYTKLAFRITYTPIFSARVLQHKPYIEPNAFKRTLIYNQNANLIETRYYGENLKGTIARMGNSEMIMSYKLSGKPTGTKLIPKIGQMWRDSHFVSAVTCAAYADHIDCTVGLSKDFNRLSQYIGINSEWRAYEVSERKAYNRDIVYRDFCVIGDAVISGIPLTIDGVYYISNIFAQSIQGDYEYYSEPITVAQVITYDEQDNPYPLSLPVVSTAFGNALVFSFGMADNYSAGAKSEYGEGGSVKGYWQTDVPYVDYYGRIKSMAFELRSKSKALQYGDAETFDLPQGNEYGEVTAPISTQSDNRLVIDKNGSEILRVNYQLEFVSNWNDLIIGSALARNCLMVTTRQTDENDNAVHAAAVYVVNKKVGRFDRSIDLASATKIYDYRDNAPRVVLATVVLGNVTSTVDGVAWVIADQSNGDILLAQNIDIAVGDTIHLPAISIIHNLP